MAKFIATKDLVKAVCACTSQSQIETVIKPQRWLDCQVWFHQEARTTPSGAMYRGDTHYSDGKPIAVDSNKALVKECLCTQGAGYSTAIINSAKSTLKSFKDWGWSQERWLDCLKFRWNGTGRQGSPRVQGYSVESEMLWTFDERAAQKFAKLLRQIKSFRGEAIPAFEKLCYQPQPVVQPAPKAQPVVQPAPKAQPVVAPAPKAEPAPVAPQPTQEDWRVVALKAAIKAGASEEAIGKMAMTLFNN